MCQVPNAMIPRGWGGCKGRMLLGSDAHMTMVGSVDCIALLNLANSVGARQYKITSWGSEGGIQNFYIY